MYNLALLLLRISLGIVFIAHGLQKAFGLFNGPGIDGFTKFLASLGFSPAVLFAYFVAYLELLGGIFILIGLFTRSFSFFLLILMVFATLKVHLAKGFFITAGGFEYNFVLISCFLSLLVAGAGKISLDNKFGCKL